MNETRITAYALNELRGNERDVFESDLASDQNLQSELASASRVADGLAQVMSEPDEGLDPQARQKLLRAIAENQQAFRQRRKILRRAVPVSLAAAASIAVLLWVAGGMTTQQPAVAADVPVAAEGVSIARSIDAKAVGLMQAAGMPTPGQPPVRQRPLLSSEEIPLWGAGLPVSPAPPDPPVP